MDMGPKSRPGRRRAWAIGAARYINGTWSQVWILQLCAKTLECAQPVFSKACQERLVSGALGQAVVVDTFKGHIMVERKGSRLGDGTRLSPQEADYELQAAWVLGPMAKLREARVRLGLEAGKPSAVATP